MVNARIAMINTAKMARMATERRNPNIRILITSFANRFHSDWPAVGCGVLGRWTLIVLAVPVFDLV